MPGETGVAQAMAAAAPRGRRAGSAARSSACRPGSKSACRSGPSAGSAKLHQAHAAIARHRELGMITVVRARPPRPPRRPESWSSAAACPVSDRAWCLGTSTGLPSTFTLDGFPGGGPVWVDGRGACSDKSVGVISPPGCASSLYPGRPRSPPGLIRRPRATNSSLNLPTKLCTGQEQASPNAQMVRPPGMLSAICIR